MRLTWPKSWAPLKSLAYLKCSQARYYPQKHVKAGLMLFAVLPRSYSTYFCDTGKLDCKLLVANVTSYLDFLSVFSFQVAKDFD